MPTLDKAIDEILAVHGILNQIGISTSSIFTTVSKPLTDGPPEVIGKIQIVVSVKQDDKEFAMTIGFFDGDTETIRKAINDGYVRWNASPRRARKKIVDESAIRREAVNLIAALVVRGFRVSRSIN